MFPALFLIFNVLGQATATSSITWRHFQRSAIVKLDTPGYPLWIMDKANAPSLYEYAEKFYWETDSPSAILLNLTMSLDNKTLLLNHKPILPIEDSNRPPLVEAYQVPADITEKQVNGLAEMGILNRQWEGLTLAWRYLALDYDRLVWADPETGPYQNHVPTLKFRVMGLGAHSRNDVLDPKLQKVLHVTLSNYGHYSSSSPDRSYGITNILFKSIDESYPYAPDTEPEEKECTTKSWRCQDDGLYRPGAPWYRFIWRTRFDQYGRIGSLRHAVLKKAGRLSEIWEDAGPAMIMSFFILMIPSMLIVIGVSMWKKWSSRRENMVRSLAEDDSLLGENVGEKYVDEDDEGGEQEVAPPLPPRPTSEGHLIDLNDSEGSH